MRIAESSLDSDGTERLFANAVTHWWDASEVYGADDAKTRTLRGRTEAPARGRVPAH